MYNTLTREPVAADTEPRMTMGDKIRQIMEIQAKTQDILSQTMTAVLGGKPGDQGPAISASCMMEAVDILHDNACRILDEVSQLGRLLQ